MSVVIPEDPAAPLNLTQQDVELLKVGAAAAIETRDLVKQIADTVENLKGEVAPTLEKVLSHPMLKMFLK